MKIKNIGKKVETKIARTKAKIAAKCGGGKAAKACALVLACGLCAALAGCGTTTPSRSQNLAITDCTINIYGSGDGTTNDVARVEIASQGMQIENSGSETQTATPQYTTDVKPDLDLHYNDALSAGASVAASGATAAKGIAEAAKDDTAKSLADAIKEKGKEVLSDVASKDDAKADGAGD